MVVISDSCCYWIRVWTHAEWRVEGRWGAGRIRQLSGKSRVKLTSRETWRHNFGGGAEEWRQVERGEWTAFSPRWGEVADGESYLFYFLPQQARRLFTYLALMLFVVARYHFSPSDILRWEKNNIPFILLYMTGKRFPICSQYVFIFPNVTPFISNGWTSPTSNEVKSDLLEIDFCSLKQINIYQHMF